MNEKGSELRSFLAERDVACPGCGYNLRGLPDAVCPECRQELRLTVGLAESMAGAMVAMLAALFAAAGASGALLTVVAILAVIFGGAPGGWQSVPLIWVPLGAFLTCGIPAAALCTRRMRAWFRTRSRNVRGWLVAAGVGVPVLWFLVFLAALLSMFR